MPSLIKRKSGFRVQGNATISLQRAIERASIDVCDLNQQAEIYSRVLKFVESLTPEQLEPSDLRSTGAVKRCCIRLDDKRRLNVAVRALSKEYLLQVRLELKNSYGSYKPAYWDNWTVCKLRYREKKGVDKAT